MNKSQLEKTAKLVKSILETNPQVRNSDNLLYLKVAEHIAAQNGYNLWAFPIPFFLISMKEYSFPPFETVRRARQKVQSQCPELKGCECVQDARKENEQIYRDFASGEIQ